MSYSFAGRTFNKHKPFFSYDYKDYSFKVDMEYGELYFTRKLISFSEKHLPINLSLKYIQRHISSTQFLHIDTGFPKGFKTNYHIFLEYDSSHNKYIYEDADGFQHNFVKSSNFSTLYYDTFGSGLMLTVENSGYKVFDDDGNYQLFDSYGRLVTIHQKITTSHYAEQTITYLNNSSLKVSTITDNYNRTISFSYTTSSIQISYDNNIVITLSINNYLLTKISKNIDGHLVEDTFTQSSFISNISLLNYVSLNFIYDEDWLITLQTNIKQDVFSFDYDAYRKIAVVTNARNIETTYKYANNQTSSHTKENGSDLTYLKINSDIASCLVKETASNPEITEFLFNNQTSIYLSGNVNGYSDYVTNNNLQPKKMYLFYAEIRGNIINSSFEVQLFDIDNNLLANLLFENSNNTTSNVLSAPVGIRASTQKQFRIKYINNSSNHITIMSARLLPLIGDFEALCSNVDFGGPIFFYGDEPHYLLKNPDSLMINGIAYPIYLYSLKYNDFLKNEKLFFKRNGTFHFWCEDQTKLLDNVSNVLICFNSEQFVLFAPDFYGITYLALVNSTLSPQSSLTFHTIKGKDDNSFIVTKKSHNSASFHTGYTSYYYEEEETKYIAGSNGHLTYYDYDENYSLVELNRDDGYQEQYSYDNNGNLISKIVSNGNFLGLIKNEFSYDSNDNLISETNLVGSSFEDIYYDYDDYGNLSLVSYPNNKATVFEYDSITGERTLDTVFCDNILEIEQYNNYVDDDSSSLSVNDNEYVFSYSAGELVGVSYNDQQIVTYTHYQEIHSGFPLNTRYVAFYLNGYYAHSVYDAYDRLLSKEGLIYTYDDLSHVTNIYDDALGGSFPNTIYAYDYYGLLTNLEVERNGLIIDFTYDIYHRLTNKSITLNNNDLYETTYFYFTNLGLENVIKKSSISIGNTTINVIDNVDGFSRLTSQTISIGNISKIKTINYCTSEITNTYTNHMIKSIVVDSYLVPSPQNPGGGFNPPTAVMLLDEYTYDSVGNIISITRKQGNTILYQTDYIYDSFSRLIRENNPNLNKTYVYNYDDDGNIVSKIEYAYSTSQTLTNPINTWNYSYDSTFPNRLNSYGTQTNDNEYDAVGNPELYRDKTMRWIKGTLLSQVIDGNITTELTYDGFKQRISKSVNNTVTDYSYIDGQLIVEQRNNGTITYLYSHQGIIGFVLSGYDSSLALNGVYLYEKNIEQDVIAIRDSNNNVVARYQYDAWGNHIVYTPTGQSNTSSTFIGNINPIRYRSYYYDTDLKMYWLTTRYYDPEVGRFISPDHYSYLDYQKLHGLNLYAYSKNNPVMYYDPSGHFDLVILSFAFVAAISYVVSSAISGVIEYAILSEHIKYNTDSKESIQIPNSGLLQNPVSNLVFVSLLVNSQNFKNNVKDPKRSAFSYWEEWEIHNIAADCFFTLGIITSILSPLLPSLKSSEKWLWKQFRRAFSVDMENDPNWFWNMFK